MKNNMKYVKIALTMLILTMQGTLSCSESMWWNKSKCKPIYYDSSSSDSRCYQLQIELSERARDGNLEQVKTLVKEGANVNGGADDYLRPITLAASNGRDLVVEFLLLQGADIDAQASGIDDTPLIAAISGRHFTTVKMLLAHGTNVCKMIDPSALDIARGRGFDEIVQLLIDAGADKCPARQP